MGVQRPAFLLAILLTCFSAVAQPVPTLLTSNQLAAARAKLGIPLAMNAPRSMTNYTFHISPLTNTDWCYVVFRTTNQTDWNIVARFNNTNTPSTFTDTNVYQKAFYIGAVVPMK